MFFQTIETERLILKNISYEDREFILQHFSDQNINRYLFDIEPISSLKEANAIIDLYVQPEPRAQHRWVIILKATKTKIGTCGFHFWDKENNCVDIGYDLQKEYQGLGIMSEAVKAILVFGITEMKLQKIEAHISIDNVKSIQLAKRLGFDFQGKTEVLSFHGKEYPHNIYTLHNNSTK